MAYDLEEQEQLASLKAFWSQYGNLLTWLLIIVLGGYSAYTWWNYHQRTQAAEASALYDELQRAVSAKDAPKIKRVAADVQEKYKSSAYATMSALMAAKAAFDANDLKTAKAQLEWAAANGSDEYKAVARLRLAAVLLDEKAYDAALAALSGEFLPQFSAAVADRKGDVLTAQNKVAEARAAYLAAYNAMDKKHPARQLVQIKLESIGGSVPEEPKPAAPAAA